MSYFTIIDKYMASPINDKRTHEEHHTRRYIHVLKLLLTLTADRLGTSTEYWSPRFSSYKGLHSAAGASRAYGACTIVIQCNDTKVNRVCTVILWGETPHTPPPPFFNLSKISNSYYTVYIFSHCNIALSSNLN